MDRRVEFDFEVRFQNGGDLIGHGFRLDVPADVEDVDEGWIARALVGDLHLLMVGSLSVSRVRVLEEAHKRASLRLGPGSTPPELAVGAPSGRRLVDLSHTIEDGLLTYRGLPPPRISDHLSREASRDLYTPGTEFHIGRIDMVANTGTYLDSPFHRYADGDDIAALDLSRLAHLPAVVVRATGLASRAIDAPLLTAALADVDASGSALLIETGWGDAHWGTDAYFEGHPFLTGGAAAELVASGAALVGVDTYNIDDTADLARPVHSTLLRAGIPIVEHLWRLGELPLTGARFTAVPAPVRGMGTFPVRAFAIVD
jgi:kynurenine formamidase